MPELARFGAFKICVFPGDHLPAHFHVLGRGWSVMIEIVSLRILKGAGPRGSVEEAIAWARVPDNSYRLCHEWRRLNERE